MNQGNLALSLAGTRRSAALAEQFQHVFRWAADDGAVVFDDDGAFEENGVGHDACEDFIFRRVRREAEFFVFVLFGAKDVVRA